MENWQIDNERENQILKIATETLSALLSENKDLKERIERLEERLCISPYGDDNIDQLEEVIKYKEDEINKLSTENYNLRQQLKFSYMICMHRNIVDNACKLKLGSNFCKYCDMNKENQS